MMPSSAPLAPAPSAQSAPVEVVTPARIQERRAFGFLALAALAALVRLALPLGVGLFLGALMGFVLEPLYEWLRRKGAKAGTAALVCVLGAMAAVTATVLGMTTMLVTRGLAVLANLRALLAPGGSARVFAEHAMTRLASWHVNTSDLSQRLESETVSVGTRATALAAQLAGVTISALLTLFFMTLSAYFFLRHWNGIVTRSERILPFERRHTHALLEQFRSVGREVLLGTVVTGIVQGVLAAVGYWATGVPEFAFFGALTAFASLLPGIGTLLVWVPIGVVRILTGHAVAGLAELVYSALMVGLASDYIVRPRLVGRQKSIPSLFMFIALFGGVEVFGVIGLILGPVAVTLSLAILRTYEREVAEHAITR
ncbi:MAG: AI-2E family transporter [Polyangiaceae bacterium]|jgi:predicted PurR-regulated permease PerM